MNTQQLEGILKGDAFVSPVFSGVFSIDRLPSFQGGAYVVNTAPSAEPKGHWVALWVTDTVEYFDSYGGDALPALKRWGKAIQWTRNRVPLQSPLSAVCGQYCIYYLLHRARGFCLDAILADFGPDVDDNDRLVYDFVHSRYALHRVNYLDTDGVVTQMARALIQDK